MRASSTIAAALLIACASCARSPGEWRAGAQGEDPYERALSALALAHVAPDKCPDVFPQLLELVDGHDEWLAPAARAELAHIAPYIVPLLVAQFTGVEGASPDCRSAVRNALVAAGPAAIVPLREQLLERGASNPKELGQILADIGPSAVAPLIDDLAAPELRRRLCTAWILGRIGRPAADAAPALTGLLERDDPSVARQAALALAEVAPQDETTRRTLERAFGLRPELADALREALARLYLQRARSGVQQDTEARLFALGGEAFVPAVEACDSDDLGLQAVALAYLRLRYAALALGLAPGLPAVRRSQERLRVDLDNRNPGTRARAALEIAQLGAGGVACVPTLAAHLHDAQAGVALSTQLALLHVVRCVAFERARRTP